MTPRDKGVKAAVVAGAPGPGSDIDGCLGVVTGLEGWRGVPEGYG